MLKSEVSVDSSPRGQLKTIGNLIRGDPMRPANLKHDATRFIIASSDSSREILPERSQFGSQSTDNCTISSRILSGRASYRQPRRRLTGFYNNGFSTKVLQYQHETDQSKRPTPDQDPPIGFRPPFYKLYSFPRKSQSIRRVQ